MTSTLMELPKQLIFGFNSCSCSQFAGSLRTLGAGSAKANFFSTQGFDDTSRDGVSDLNTQVPEIHQSPPDAATPEFFSFDSPAAAPTIGDQLAAQPYEGFTPGRTYQPRGVYKVLKSAGPDVS